MKKTLVLIIITAIILLPAMTLAKEGNNGKGYGRNKDKNTIETMRSSERSNGEDNNRKGNNGIGIGKGLSEEEQQQRQERREAFQENKLAFQELKLQRKEQIREQKELMEQWKAEIQEQFGDLEAMTEEERAAYWEEFEALKQAMREAHRFCLEIRAAQDDKGDPVVPEEPEDIVPTDPPTEDEVDALANII